MKSIIIKPYDHEYELEKASVKIGIFLDVACAIGKLRLDKKIDALISPPKKDNSIFSPMVVDFFENLNTTNNANI